MNQDRPFEPAQRTAGVPDGYSRIMPTDQLLNLRAGLSR